MNEPEVKSAGGAILGKPLTVVTTQAAVGRSDSELECPCLSEAMEEDIGKKTASKKQRKHCRFFLTEKGCRFGDRCKFEHIKDVSDGEDVSEESCQGKSTGLLQKPSFPHVQDNQPPSSDEKEIDLQTENVQTDVVKLHEEGEQQAEVLNSEEKSSGENSEVDRDRRVGGAIVVELRQFETGKVKGQTSTKRRPLCRYFTTKRGCLRRENCKFSHAKKPEKSTSFVQTNENSDCGCESENKLEEGNNLENFCDNVAELCVEKTNQRGDHEFRRSQTAEPRKIFKKPGLSTGVKLSSLSNLELQVLRKVEIKQLHRRFGCQGKIKVLKDDEDAVFEILFAPSDPDWPFDVSEIVLQVQFSKDYPRKMFHCYISEDQELPQQLIRYVNEDIKKWIINHEEMRQMKDTVELPFRPFLRWLDRNLELFFIKAGRKMKMLEEAEAAGFEFVPYHFMATEDSQETILDATKNVESQSPNSSGKAEAESSLTDLNERQLNLTSQCQHFSRNDKMKTGHYVSELHPSDNSTTASGSCNSEEENLSLSIESDNKENITKNIVSCSAERKGTEIKLKGLELSENTSTVRSNCVALTMECAQCRGREDHQMISTRCQSVKCSRCFTSQSFTYRSAIVHPTSSILGYLDLNSCHPFDLVLTNCEFVLGCLNCSHETPVKGLCYGSTHRWCSHCHSKLSLHLESTRFYQLQPLAAQSSKPSVTETSKPKKEPKTPSLKTGQPLPDSGTCKHYKKSFRWLRFPCCGKCYPCDVCHDEKEDHEMKFATRMVCGYCSKEQPYSQNPCIECKSSVTKSRTSHWEGGKGCRDKVHMSRGDDRKYKNTNKTVSRKAVSQSGGKQELKRK